MYADTVTGSMRRAIDETERRRGLQDKYNKEHGIIPATIKKDIRKIIESLEPAESTQKPEEQDLSIMIENLTDEMLAAAEMLEFERAAQLRDRIQELKDRQK